MLQTARLTLRQWYEEDIPAFIALNADPEVMAFFPVLSSAADTQRLVGDSGLWR